MEKEEINKVIEEDRERHIERILIDENYLDLRGDMYGSLEE